MDPLSPLLLLDAAAAVANLFAQILEYVCELSQQSSHTTPRFLRHIKIVIFSVVLHSLT